MFYGTYLIVINTSDYRKSSKEPKKYAYVAIGWEIGPSLTRENWSISPKLKIWIKNP